MKIYFLPMLLSLFFLGACDKNDEIIPEDADENFITSVVMTVDGKSYTACLLYTSIDIQRLSSSKTGNDLVAEPLLYFAFFPLSLRMRY